MNIESIIKEKIKCDRAAKMLLDNVENIDL